jgi:rsbT co-antagonist protein RsbR
MTVPPPDYLEDLWTHGREGLHIVSAEAIILDANAADFEPLGYTREEYVGHDIREFHVDSEVIADILVRLLAGEEIYNYEARLRCKDGSIRIVSITSNIRRDSCSGRMINTRCFTRDVTEIATLRRQLEQQAAAIKEMALPIFEIWSGVLSVPIVGILDSERAAQLTERLLSRISSTRARYAIIDLTGIAMLDTGTANHLLKTVRAATLIGGQILLTGIRPEVARMMVTVGIDLGSVVTLRTVEQGLRWCMARMGTEPHAHR